MCRSKLPVSALRHRASLAPGRQDKRTLLYIARHGSVMAEASYYARGCAAALLLALSQNGYG
eukprot:CAMPEP_0185913164 /NCGR_PEP_ID=MMETSP0196C-20130402/42943_1 /TAXON_ID=2932 /ORGANISM="Alexandrium fundyense, Strain CCMP1719" /LENGTH=61 /DNA_ID=CAMNT_0028634501 /DNA_START=633 /DNA_END=814 /DNA_ORIENTATION=-